VTAAALAVEADMGGMGARTDDDAAGPGGGLTGPEGRSGPGKGPAAAGLSFMSSSAAPSPMPCPVGVSPGALDELERLRRMLAPSVPDAADGEDAAASVDQGVGRWELEIAPGMIRLHARQRRPDAASLEVRRRHRQTRELSARHEELHAARHRDLASAPREPGEPGEAEDAEEAAAERRRRWARRSRSRMVARFATLDYAPLFDEATRLGGRLGLLTLTLPGDWERLAPDPQAMMRMLAAFRRRWHRAIGAPYALWKLEFQARGAPHVHMLMACPPAVAGEPFTDWLSRTWFEVVGSGDERHLLAGTGVDWDEPTTMTSPQAAAIYFARHAAAGQAKDYQHLVPDIWADAGRFRWWGMWHLAPQIWTATIDHDTAVFVRRLLRHQYRVWHGRRRRILASGRRDGSVQGGFVLVRDGPAFAAQLARAIEICGPHTTRPTSANKGDRGRIRPPSTERNQL